MTNQIQSMVTDGTMYGLFQKGALSQFMFQKPSPNSGKLMVLCMGSLKTLQAKNDSGNLFQFMTQKSCKNLFLIHKPNPMYCN